MPAENKYKLRFCVWEITLKCCFSCKYCGSGAGSARPNELNESECIDVAKQLVDIGCERVSLIGGEVFMRPDWFNIASTLTSGGTRVSIITNGFLFSEALISKLKQANISSVAISLDGVEDIHDAYRQRGSFKRAMSAIDVLVKNDILVSVISTLHSDNYLCLDEMYECLKDKGIFAWQLQACSPMGNASGGRVSTDIDFNHVISFVKKHLNDTNFSIGIADNIGYYTEDEGHLRGGAGNSHFCGCRAGLDSIGIDSVGNVRGCESMYDEAFIEGNLRDNSLKAIWDNPNAFSYNRGFRLDMLGGGCKGCEYARYCAGGCRSYNYFSCGDMYSSPRCARNK